MRGLGLDIGFGGEPHVPEAVGAAHAMHAVAVVDIVGAADILDDVQALADREDRGGLLHRVGELTQIAANLDHHAVVLGDPLLVGNGGAVRLERRANARDRLLGLRAAPDQKAQGQPPLARLAIEGEAGRIRPTVLTTIEHVDPGAWPRPPWSAVFLRRSPAIPHIPHLPIWFVGRHRHCTPAAGRSQAKFNNVS